MKDVWRNIDAICSLRKLTGADAEPSIPESIVGWYEECHIANYTRGSLFLLKAADGAVVTEIKKSPLPATAREHYAEVIYRSVNGSRERNKSGRMDAEIERHQWKIPAESLKHGPIFLPEIATMLGTETYKGTMLNPASRAYREALVRDLGEELSTAMYRHPVSIVANDPTGYFKRLYVIINGEIVSVRVSHYVAEDAADTISLIRRTNSDAIPDSEVEIASTSFAHLNLMPNHVWAVGAYHISTDRQALVDWLAQTNPEQTSNLMPLSEHKRILANSEAEWAAKHKSLTAANDVLVESNRVLKDTAATNRNEIQMLKNRLEQRESPDYSATAEALWTLQSHTEHLKAQNEADAARRKLLDDEIKMWREAQKWRHDEAQKRSESISANFKHGAVVIGALLVVIKSAIPLWKILIAYIKPKPVAA